MKTPNTILFDLDGTLTNTDSLHLQTWQDILKEYGLSIDQEFYDRHFSGRLNQDIIPDILPQLSVAEATALGDRKEAEFRHRAVESLVPLSGLLTLLDWIDTHSLKKGIVTNAPRQNAEFMVQVLELRDRFPTIVIAEELEFGKPHPMPYLVGLEKLGASAEHAIVFEDSPTGIQSAVRAGIFTIGVASTHSPDALYDLGASLVISDFTDPKVMKTLVSGFPSS
ncbi:MAG: HAD family phosphatase [Merismopedia sp. SIO2A8]|nr:HAD family phosphatase [Symploca sp. SIO2B6]NET49102.1 HAD family phosphatase [Merismopedia sp. SIO2A8]